MRIAIPQLNYQTGNIKANTDKILHAIKKAKAEKAELIIFPELAICGPVPKDLLGREEFINECRLAVEKIAGQCGNLATIVGAPNLDPEHGIMYNSAYFIENGEVVNGVHKTILSDYDVFDESRYFIAGEENVPIRYKNKNIRIIFDEYEAEEINGQDSVIVHIGMSPFTTESLTYRQQFLSTLAQKHRKAIISINHVGGNTSIIFDGNAMVYNTKGCPIIRLQDFGEDFVTVDLAKTDGLPVLKQVREDYIALIHNALTTGIRDYFKKHGFTKAVLGLSGGLDSAVVAALAVEALGKENVIGILMPSHFSTDHSVRDALSLVKNTGIEYHIIPIKEIYDQYSHALHPLCKEYAFDATEENIQARIRGMLIMAMSNKFGYIALNTSNKSEAAVGYGTLYGDMCGSLSVIGDVYKTDAFKLALHINRSGIIIPENTITKAPSAELRPDQKDCDSLPDYNVLDGILRLYIEENLSAEAILNKGYDKETIHRIIRLTDRSEYKRAQCPPILKVSKKAFGSGRRLPF